MSGTSQSLTCLDLFCGCGGFSLGMHRAGFRTVAAIDFNPEALVVYRHNFPDVGLVFEEDLTTFGPGELDRYLGGTRVDVIVGGPPCQGFSLARRRDGANHGTRLKEDTRRHLYQEFLRHVSYYQPRLFVMENVLGIKSAAGGEFFTRVQAEARALGYRVHGEEIHAWHYGVPQKRIRQLIIGTRRELPIFTARRFMPPRYAESDEQPFDVLPAPVSLWEAIGDLPPLAAGSGTEDADYDMRRIQSQLARYGGRYLKKVLQIQRARQLTAHRARPHSERDLRDFAILQEGESSAVAMRERHVEFEWPYSKEYFKDRYTRQHRHRLCSTIVAHLSKDGLMFIHPTQNRSLTPREAARVQSFPDWFQFPVARTHQFRLIGNAVPPLVGQAVGQAVRRYLAAAARSAKHRHRLHPMPRDDREAVAWLRPLVAAADAQQLESVSGSEFRRGWFSLGFIHNLLHPDSTSDNGSHQIEGGMGMSVVRYLAPELVSPVFTRSGWPVRLVPIEAEARRRLSRGELRQQEFYCSDAQLAGYRYHHSKHRNDDD